MKQLSHLSSAAVTLGVLVVLGLAAIFALAKPSRTTSPPPPAITEHPANPTTSTSATFSFADGASGVRLECSLDSGAWTSCASPITYRGLNANARHEFSVRAVDTAGNPSNQTSFQWKILPHAEFTISGSPAGLLYPGAPALAIPVTLTNPDDSDLYVTSLTVTIDETTLPSGCKSSWFVLVQSNVSSGNVLRIPGHSSLTLPAQGVLTPTIRLINAPEDQDACRNAVLSLNYQGSAHS